MRGMVYHYSKWRLCSHLLGSWLRLSQMRVACARCVFRLCSSQMFFSSSVWNVAGCPISCPKQMHLTSRSPPRFSSLHSSALMFSTSLRVSNLPAMANCGVYGVFIGLYDVRHHPVLPARCVHWPESVSIWVDLSLTLSFPFFYWKFSSLVFPFVWFLISSAAIRCIKSSLQENNTAKQLQAWV